MNNGKICVSVCAETKNEFIAKIKRAKKIGDVIELRFDCLKKEEFTPPEPFVQNENYIFTFRSKEQGGDRDITLEEREYFWNCGIDFCGGDFEEDIVENSYYWLYHPVICSFHDFGGTPQNLDEIYERIGNTGADIIKIAVSVKEITESIKVWSLLKKIKIDNKEEGSKKPGKVKSGFKQKLSNYLSGKSLDKTKSKDVKNLIPIAMGEAGKWTRILGLAYGSPITYASLEEGNETAPGQISAKDLKEVYRVKELNEETEIYGIIGNPVSHSLSPYMHNAAFKHFGLNGVYIPLEVSDPDKFFKLMVRDETREIDWNLKGFSVTIPHKESILKHLDHIDEAAQSIGAVNTVQKIEGKLHGFNTDEKGFIKPLLNAYGSLKNTNVGILGNGGAARACIYALKKENAKVTIFARTPRKAENLANDFNVDLQELSTQYPEPGTQHILINTTPLGTIGRLEKETPVSGNQMKNLHLVYDLVYNPFETKFIREAKKLDVPTLGGLAMLVAQGIEQFKIWTKREVPIEIMSRPALNKLR